MILKTNFHFHTSNDEKSVSYDIYQGIDRAKEQDFDVLAYTPHDRFIFKPEFATDAEKKGLLLIPGIEAKIKGKHVLVLNCDKSAEQIKSFEELRDYKKKNPQIFIIAPHPFVWSYKSLFSKLKKNIDLFDAIELSVFSNQIFNFNKKAAETAAKYDKPLIANSDTHFIKDINRGYSLIETENKTVESLFGAIRQKKFKNHLKPMSIFAMAEIQLKFRFRSIFRPLKRPYKSA